MPTRNRPRTITVEEFAEMLGVHEKTLRQAINRNEAPGYKLGNRIVIPADAVDEFMAGRWIAARERLVEELIVQVHEALGVAGRLTMRRAA
jgi:excisionase family DNA binding protein